MSGKFLLDTNIAIALLIDDASLSKPAPSANLFISCVAVGELFYGALNSNKIDDNVHRLANFVSDTVVVNCDEVTARIYGEIKSSLRKKGRPIPDNDIWIAASTKQHSLTLVTRDEHFKHVANLDTVRW